MHPFQSPLWALALLFAISAGTATAGDPADFFRVSALGPEGYGNYDAGAPAVAANPDAGEFLVVWSGDDDAGDLVDEELEIFGQRIDAVTGAELGSDDFRISRMGPDQDTTYGPDACTPLESDPDCGPAVAYGDGVYLVVWSSDDDAGALTDGEFEIYGRRVDGETGAVLDADDVRLSDIGSDGITTFDAFEPDVVYNEATGEFFIVFVAPLFVQLSDPELEVIGQRFDPATGEVGVNDFRVSFMGPSGSGREDFDARHPSVAYDPSTGGYLVVWDGDDEAGDLVDNELEIYGRRLSSSGGLLGSQFRISTFGPDGERDLDAEFPTLVATPGTTEWMLFYQGTNEDLPEEASEIYGQRLNRSDGSLIGSAFQISEMGGPGDLVRSALRPVAAADTRTAEVLVAWQGDDDRVGLANNELEIFGQLVDAEGVEIGEDDVRLSAMGPDGSADFSATRPAIAYESSGGVFPPGLAWRRRLRIADRARVRGVGQARRDGAGLRGWFRERRRGALVVDRAVGALAWAAGRGRG